MTAGLVQWRQFIDEHVLMLDERSLRRLRIQITRRGEHGITQGLGIEPAAVVTREQEIVGILFTHLVITQAAELIGAAENDAADETLDGPAFAHETGGEVVEQFRMRGPLTRGAEVIRGAHQTLAKKMLPHAVDHHPRGEWMLRTGQPPGELEPAALFGIRDLNGRGPAGAEKTARDGGPEFFGIAVDVEFAIDHGPGLARAHGERCITGIFEGGSRRRAVRFVFGNDGFRRRMHGDFGGRLELMERRLRCRESLMSRRAPEGLGAPENAGQRVIIAGGNGVRFVIVTARAADTEPHDAAADDVDLIGDDIHFEIVIHRLGRLGPESEQAGGDELRIAPGG